MSRWTHRWVRKFSKETACFTVLDDAGTPHAVVERTRFISRAAHDGEPEALTPCGSSHYIRSNAVFLRQIDADTFESVNEGPARRFRRTGPTCSSPEPQPVRPPATEPASVALAPWRGRGAGAGGSSLGR